MASLSTKVRVRVKYSPVLAITGQMYGPWRYMPGYLNGASTHNSVPLPVELLYFNAEVNEQKKVDISWATASELNNDYFVVQHSKDGVNWETVTEIDGAGNSNVFLSYATTDDLPFSGISYYRLKQVDIDNKTTYSEIRLVKLDVIDKISVYPNPVKNFCIINLNQQSDIQTLELYNTNGTKVKSVSVEKSETVNLDMSNLETGVYILYADNKVVLSKLIKE